MEKKKRRGRPAKTTEVTAHKRLPKGPLPNEGTEATVPATDKRRPRSKAKKAHATGTAAKAPGKEDLQRIDGLLHSAGAALDEIQSKIDSGRAEVENLHSANRLLRGQIKQDISNCEAQRHLLDVRIAALNIQLGMIPEDPESSLHFRVTRFWAPDNHREEVTD